MTPMSPGRNSRLPSAESILASKSPSNPSLYWWDNYPINYDINILLGLWSLFTRGVLSSPEIFPLAAEGWRRAGAFFFAPASLSSAPVMNCRGELPKPVCFGLDQLFFSL